ncbi:CoA-binding protein [Edaphobacter paludis]|uniref:CoA-binding protein n=1 Tax=Edaphobacter paludis TaxID=3035702 RepID=A0AAU7D1W0_9BACT
MNQPEIIRAMLGNPAAKPVVIAVIGLSPHPDKPSHFVPAYMQQHGYRILPVNPTVDSVLGEKSYASLADLPIKPDIVNVFRLPRYISAIVDEMLQLGLQSLWVQSGIINLEAAAKAEAGGIHVVMDHCIMVEHRRVLPLSAYNLAK